MRISRLRVVGICGFVLSVLAAEAVLASSPTLEGEPRKRSVLFYLIDTCRADRMSFQGYERPTTPFLEELAERSVVFENCFSQAPWTKPSMASLLCSQYPSTTGVYLMMQRLRDDAWTWPELMQANGYYTAGFSSNVVMGNSLSNFAQGFDHFVESTLINRGDAIRFASGSARKLNAHAFPWLDETDHWPMLLYLHSVDPHEEYAPEEEYLGEFADQDRDPEFRKEWQRLLDSRPPIPGLHVTQSNFERAKVDRHSFIEHGSNLYDADILANDDQLLALWDKIQEDGWGDDFIFVLTSDHGEEFFEHGATSHGYSLYNEMIRVPLMICAPGLLPEGLVVEENVRLLDVYPTLCDLLGLEIPASVQGDSLLPLIENPRAWSEQPILSEHREDPGARALGQGSGVMISVQSGPWKFILNQKPPQQKERPRYELYDIEEDPGERDNVAEAFPEVVEDFELEVATFLADYREGADLEEWVAEDEAVLDQLRQLGYLPEEGEESVDFWAVLREGTKEEVEAALAAVTDLDGHEPGLGVGALATASFLGRFEIAELLLAQGADVNDRGADGSTALHGAALFGHDRVAGLLLDHGADTSIQNFNGHTPLDATSIDWGLTEMVAQVLGIELDESKARQGRGAVSKRLREHELQGSVADSGRIQLFAAVQQGDVKKLRKLVEDGMDLNQQDPLSGTSALALAALLGHTSVAKLLVESGAKIEARAKDGATALHGAALMGHPEIAQVLIEAGADVKAKTLVGDTPLQATEAPWEFTLIMAQLLGVEIDQDQVLEGREEVVRILTAAR